MLQPQNPKHIITTSFFFLEAFNTLHIQRKSRRKLLVLIPINYGASVAKGTLHLQRGFTQLGSVTMKFRVLQCYFCSGCELCANLHKNESKYVLQLEIYQGPLGSQKLTLLQCPVYGQIP